MITSKSNIRVTAALKSHSGISAKTKHKNQWRNDKQPHGSGSFFWSWMILGRLRVRFHGISRHFSPSLTFWFRSMGVSSSKGLRRNLYESPGWGKPPALTTEGPETKRQVYAKQTDFRPFTSSRPWSLRSQVLVFLVFSFMFQLISRDAFAAKKKQMLTITDLKMIDELFIALPTRYRSKWLLNKMWNRRVLRSSNCRNKASHSHFASFRLNMGWLGNIYKSVPKQWGFVYTE